MAKAIYMEKKDETHSFFSTSAIFFLVEGLLSLSVRQIETLPVGRSPCSKGEFLFALR